MSRIGRRGFITGAAATGLAMAGGRARARSDAVAEPAGKFIVPLAPGGAIDFIARPVGDVCRAPSGNRWWSRTAPVRVERSAWTWR